MPNINCCNLDEEKAMSLSQVTCDKLAQTIGCPVDWLNYIVKSEKIIIENEMNSESCYIHVEWFKRSNEVMDKVVEILDGALRDLGYQEIFIYFTELSSNNFYENKQKFDV